MSWTAKSKEVALTSAIVGAMLGFVGGTIHTVKRTPVVEVEKIVYITRTPATEVPIADQAWFRGLWEYTYSVPEEKNAIIDCANFRDSDFISLACNVYWEARGEDFLGQVAVAQVTKNRVEARGFKSTYADVVWERRGRIPQFEWTFNGKSDVVREHSSWFRALTVAALVRYNAVDDTTNGALFYHKVGLNNSAVRWFENNLVFDQEIGNHAFYLANI